MTNGGPWEPPRPEPTQAGEAFPPPSASAPTTTVEPTPTPSRRSRLPLIGAVVGVVALVAAAVFAISRVTGDDSAGGAASPEDAGLAMLAAIEQEDVLGVVDLLLPGERDTLREPMTQLVDELRRLEVLSDDADLGGIAGIDIELDDERVEVAQTNVDDIVNLRISASGRGSIDGEELPIGDLVLDNVDADPDELSTSASADDELTIPVTAVRHDGRWYLSAFYTVAETARQSVEDPPPIPDEGIAAPGAASPQDAMDDLLDAVESLDVEGIIAGLNPDEFGALQRYAPIFLDDAQEAMAEAPFTLTIDDAEYEVSGSGDRRSMTVSYLRISVDDTEDPGTITLEDGCWIIEARDETLNSCELDDRMPELDEVFEDSEAIEDLLTSFQETFADYENPGFIVEQVGGGWYVSPMATVADQVLAVIESLSREEIEDLQRQVQEVIEIIGDDLVFETDELLPTDDDVLDYTPPGDEGETTPTTVFEDPAADCYLEEDASAAGACFQTLIDAGSIESQQAPIYVLFPDCGLAESYWSGDYYDLPDAEFVATAEQAAPCFDGHVAAGEIDEFELPPELANPECLQGRNFYGETDDTYVETFSECAYG